MIQSVTLPIAEINSAKNIQRAYLWGLDMSGGLAGQAEEDAGGIGGLLMISDLSGTDAHHFTGYDGNGNITTVVSASGGGTTARYEYSPYGELIRSSGTYAGTNPFRFSTKYQDNETDLIYYGYRYYHPALGTWINRDPIEEAGGMNLYAFVMNNPIGNIDPDGRFIGLLITTSLRMGGRSALIGAITNGAAGYLFSSGSDPYSLNRLMKDMVTGAVSGYFWGALGAGLKDAFQLSGIFANGMLGGISAVAGTIAGTATGSVFDGNGPVDGLADMFATSEGRTAFSIGVILGAAGAMVGGHFDEALELDGWLLDIPLDLAGSVGGSAATEIWGNVAEGLESLRPYR